ncbi:hypothetical protein LD001_28070 [Pseudomonas kurunegalensis]|uniref:hypothetical protein n=1 Tax=Pseudomonas kurunegalensis TaxID=485880 RepID=UPI001CDCB535|nr:hypothetical protein [Pseudomonas kurunegalensis]MCA4079091.1 hypothetical protein [Pseudomonas kurunegalensis]
MTIEVASSTASIWSYISEFLKLTPGLILLPLSLVIGWKKIGHKAVISYYISHNRFEAPRLTQVVLTNLKDKPLIVHALYADIDHHALLKIKEYESPLIIKGLETLVIETDPVSLYTLGQDAYEPDFDKIKAIHVVTTGTSFQCTIDRTPSVHSLAKRGHYQQIKATSYQYLGLTITDEVRYGLAFKIGGSVHAAIVDKSGFIGGNWPFGMNCLLAEHMQSAEQVKAVLNETYGEVLGDSLVVHELNLQAGNPFTIFRKIQ